MSPHFNAYNGVNNSVRLHYASYFNAAYPTIITTCSRQGNELMWIELGIVLVLVLDDAGLSAPTIYKPNVSYRVLSFFKHNFLEHSLLGLLMVKCF